MNKDIVLNKFHDELRVNAYTTGFRREVTPYVVRHVSEYEDGGFILASHLNEKNAREVILSELEYFKEIGQSFEWKLYSYDRPEELKDLLLEAGFEEEEEEALMVMELSSGLLHSPPFSQVVEIQSEAGVEDIIFLMNDIWGEDHSELGKRLWRDKQYHPESLYLYGVYDKGELVSGAWMYFERESCFASLWGGATRPAYRGKGYYRALISIRAKKAQEHGYSFLTVDARPMSRPILEKLGFQCLAYTYGMQSN
ncbi:GNAT family N-acetyltransferase [Halobacillus sp. H74]|uniref:GNAT family N-acetyltransferase n=1 Tax=Halobacillus sp. H74 TaxID=3457436 RepID=UPI003FCE9BCC